jgi:hypothetical protein
VPTRAQTRPPCGKSDYQENTMKKILSLFLLSASLLLSACIAVATATPTTLPPTDTSPPATPLPTDILPTEEQPAEDWNLYTNSAFGFSFQYPSAWFGPDEYVVEQTLRLSVGSDIVYPYGTSREEQIYEIANSYYVVIQYMQNNPDHFWSDFYQALAMIQDGESLLGNRSLIIRVRQLELGGFKGFEYISTLSETAQTEYSYSREVILYAEQSNDLLTIMGYANNVMINDGADWRAAYQMVDEANLDLFRQIVESIIIE